MSGRINQLTIKYILVRSSSTGRGQVGLHLLLFFIMSIYLSYLSITGYRARFHNLEEPLRETNLASLSISALIYQGRPFRNLLSPLRTPLFAGTPLPTPSVFPKSIYPQPSSLKGSDSTEVRTFQLSSLSV